MRTAALLAATVLVTGTGCGTGGTRTLTVLAASSLSDVFPPLGRHLEQEHPGTRVRFSFGASSTLAAQVRDGAPADVFAAAGPAPMATVAGEAPAPVTFARNSAVIAVARGSTVHALADLAHARVALCRPEVPCGALAREVLARAHVEVVPATYGGDVRAVLAAVRTGEVDAGIVYTTDTEGVDRVTIPAADNASTAYPIAVLAGSRQPALAAAFTALVLSPAGQQALRRAGFGSP